MSKFNLRTVLALCALYGGTAAASEAASEAPALPANLELEYSFSYEGIEVGRASKKLRRIGENHYAHSMWMRPTGMARALTSVEWVEEGEFIVRGKDVLPQRYMEIRRGDKRGYERRTQFDWEKMLLNFNDGKSLPFTMGTQDQASIIYAIMINPLIQPGERQLLVTDGKDIDPYKLVYMGQETLKTPIGRIDTIVLKRLSQRQMEREEQCRKERKIEDDCPVDDFLVWIAPSKRHLAVKLQKRKKQQTLTLVLRNAQGL